MPRVPAVGVGVHHTVSQIRYMRTAGGTESDPLWIESRYTREIWIGPSGSGRIAEAFDPPRFPSEAERLQALALGEALGEGGVGANDFEPRELVYFSDAQLRQRLGELNASPSSELMRFFSSYLTEMVPSRDLVVAAIDAAAKRPDIAVTHDGPQTVVSMVLPDEARTLVEFELDTSSGRLLHERRTAQVPRPGLDMAAPLVMLDRLVTVSEDLAQWEPPPLPGEPPPLPGGPSPLPRGPSPLPGEHSPLPAAPRTRCRHSVEPTTLHPPRPSS